MFANTAITASSLLNGFRFLMNLPKNRSRYGWIGIKIGNPANISGADSLIGFRLLVEPL
jgi:hypothetical protein